MADIISVRDLSVVLGGRFQALKRVSFELEKGKITGFIGPSGAGKTTLIRVIVGRQRVRSGQVTVLGFTPGSKELRSQISYMTQEISVYSDLTVHENLLYFARMCGLKGRQALEACRQVLSQVAMTEKSGVLVMNLSGGQKQRVSLAIALLGDPELLVLDEPTVGLDPVLREQLWKLFRELAANGTTIIVSSHVMDEAERCEDLLLIRDGQIVAHDTPPQLCKRTNTKTVEQAFLKLAGAQK
ncbi:MAG TPA: ABC transporter ATP-binding protein [Candidatus Saccharimonadia bacterium]|nr:ABC transporter ATP-binding protein [Candidatus Saccharimonadia bacterium]